MALETRGTKNSLKVGCQFILLAEKELTPAKIVALENKDVAYM